MTILAQLAPESSTDRLLYECPEEKEARLNVWIANSNLTVATVRLYHVVESGMPVIDAAVFYDRPIGGNDTEVSPTIEMDAGEQLWIRANLTAVAFAANGVESFIIQAT